MDVPQIRAFLAVAEELHFGRAAERLHIAQPPLSRTIKQLERELRTTLFDRSTRSVRLTASGRALVGPATEVLDALRRAELSVQAVEDGVVGEVRVAFAGISTHGLVARLARVVRSRRPGIQLELSSQNFAQPVMKKLMQGETDIALGRWDAAPAGVDMRVVMPDTLVLAVPDTHPLAVEGLVTAERLAAEPFVSLPLYEGSVLPDRLRRLALASGFVADVVQVAPDTQTALALVAAEVGCHLTLASVAENATDPHVTFVAVDTSALEPGLDVDLRAAWRRRDAGAALHAVLADLFELGEAG
ncbi:MAG: LysR family transcriptional regulator [Actinobacteria bacterium]|nr:LysR family transcriptional regulator [Actinomycetota bacterium]